MCARMWMHFQLPEGASCAQCAPEAPAKPTELVPCTRSAAQAETARGLWDIQSIFDSGTSDQFMPYGQLFAPQIGPSGGAEFAKQHSSAMRCSLPAARLRDCVDAAQGHLIRNAERFFLKSLLEGIRNTMDLRCVCCGITFSRRSGFLLCSSDPGFCGMPPFSSLS